VQRFSAVLNSDIVFDSSDNVGDWLVRLVVFPHFGVTPESSLNIYSYEAVT